ncbi:MAG: N-formylglutamate amidohydrolase [Rhizobiaceae bacterium]
MSETTDRAARAALIDLAENEGAEPVNIAKGAAGIPVVFDSPHSGRYYPDDFNSVVSRKLLREYEDRFVDLLIGEAAEHGVTTISAHFPRAYIDPNRAPDDIDEEMLEAVWPEPLSPTRHSRQGTGLIFRRMHDDSPIYEERLTLEEVQRRLDGCWRPYHAALETALAAAERSAGAVWHVNWHSMRPVGDAMTPDPGETRADFVLGDLQGKSCEPAFTSFMAERLEAMGYSVAINHPYQGAYIVQRHGRPEEGRHSLQIEVNRGLYMDLGTLEKIDRFDEIRRDVGRLAGELVDWAQARVKA